MSVATEQPTYEIQESLEEQNKPLRPIQSERIAYLDNLRALAMLLGVFLHAAFAYARPAQTIWLATDSQSSIAVDVAIWFIHLFRMGLFFLLSGYFAKLVIERKGTKQFIWNRCLRILFPFILFFPFLLAATTVVFVFSLSYLDQPRGLMGLIAESAKNNPGSQEQQSPGLMHLWFLYYLMAFSAIGALAYQVKRFDVGVLFRHPRWLILSPVILIPAALASGTPMPAPESFVPDIWPFAFYGVYFFAGWQLRGREHLLGLARPYVWYFVGISAVLFVPYYLLMPYLDLNTLVSQNATQSVWVRCVEASLTAYLSVLLTIASLLLGQRYLSRKSSFLNFLSDASYWIYLVHLPIVLFLQTLLIPLPLPYWLKLIAVIIGTTVPCLATYLVFVRYTPLGWLLHGKRSFP